MAVPSAAIRAEGTDHPRGYPRRSAEVRASARQLKVRPMDYAVSPFEIKATDEAGHIEGLLAGFGDVDHGGDVLLPGCFKASLTSRSAPLPMLLNHDLRKPIGAWTTWQERPEGLFTKGKLTLAAPDAQIALALARDGALGGLSIGWKAKRQTVDQRTGVRTIHEAELFEGSLVSVPMNDRTRVTSVKSFGCARDFAELFRDAGISDRRANRIAGLAWKALNETNDDAAAAEAVAAILNRSAARLAAL